MGDRRHATLAEADTAVGDCRDLFHVLGLILAASPGPLDGITRDALATVARLGAERGKDASGRIEQAMTRGAAHG